MLKLFNYFKVLQTGQNLLTQAQEIQNQLKNGVDDLKTLENFERKIKSLRTQLMTDSSLSVPYTLKMNIFDLLDIVDKEVRRRLRLVLK